MQAPFTIRPVDPNDDLEQITQVIRSAYKQLSDMGLRYWATWQEAEDTRKRFEEGHGLVALLDDRYVGTLTIYPPDPDNKAPAYRDPATYGIGQFAVDPAVQGSGLGKALHTHAESWVRDHGGRRMALDTAEGATHLIAMYERWGYRIVEHVDWRPFTNYLSVIMAKELE